MRARGAALHTLVGAYAMDAVSEKDRAAFERHLLTCEQCREDVRGLRETAAHLAAAAAVPPRPELRSPTLRAAERIRQLPPVVPGEQAGRHGGRSLLAARRLLVGGGSGGRHPWMVRLAACTAVALAVTAIVLGVHLSTMQGRLSAAQQRDNAIAAVLGAHDTTTLTAQVRTGGTATVVMSHRTRTLVFIGNDLARLPASKAYELWLMGPGGPTSAGVLAAAHHGMTGPVVVSRLAPGDRLGLTVEPSAGSGRPTSAPVVMVALGP